MDTMRQDDTSVTTTPVSVITGFLGAGKTTLLNRLLGHAALCNAAVIINEFGEIGLDHLIVATPAENTVLLRNGCLCCTVQGELTTTLLDLDRGRREGSFPPFERVLVETTGLADPTPILQSLLGDDELAPIYHVGCVITLVDAVNGPAQLESCFEVQKQVATADTIVVSKVDLVLETDVAEFESRLSGINRTAIMLRAIRGECDIPRLVAMTSALTPTMREPRWLPAMPHTGPRAGGSTTFRHGDITTFAVTWPGPVSRASLLTWLHLLASFKGPDLLRMKGIVNVGGTPVVVNTVQSLIHEPYLLERWPSEDRQSNVVFITRGVERSQIEATLVAFSFADEQPANLLDPQRYARFASMVGNFHALAPSAEDGWSN